METTAPLLDSNQSHQLSGALSLTWPLWTTLSQGFQTFFIPQFRLTSGLNFDAAHCWGDAQQIFIVLSTMTVKSQDICLESPCCKTLVYPQLHPAGEIPLQVTRQQRGAWNLLLEVIFTRCLTVTSSQWSRGGIKQTLDLALNLESAAGPRYITVIRWS